MFDDFYTSFFTDGWVGHLSYVLLILSMMMRNMTWLRIFAVSSGLAGVAFDLFWLKNPVGAFWEGLFLMVNLVQLLLIWRRDRRASFSYEERTFLKAKIRSGTAGAKRLLLDLGRWDDLAPGAVLAEQGKRPDFLCYIAGGRVRIEVDGQEVSQLGEGHFIGEMSLIGDGVAQATVTVTKPLRTWRIERDKVERLRDTRPELYALIEVAIAHDLSAKIIRGNRKAVRAARPGPGGKVA